MDLTLSIRYVMAGQKYVLRVIILELITIGPRLKDT